MRNGGASPPVVPAHAKFTASTPNPHARLVAMLVYGDQKETRGVSLQISDINHRCGRVASMDPGLPRHAQLVAALIEAGQLLQGLADIEFDDPKIESRSPAADKVGRFLLDLSRAVCRSWDSGFQEVSELPKLAHDPSWSSETAVKIPEGFAFYAVYPEAYIEAARRLRLLAAPVVIGLRSIGTTLASIVAAAIGAPLPIHLRPFGDPSDRQIAIDTKLERELLGGDSHYIIVDEGPGRSGSSFAAVADWLMKHGVPPRRIALLPSHPGEPGAAATEARRNWWREVQREPADFDGGWSSLLTGWCRK